MIRPKFFLLDACLGRHSLSCSNAGSVLGATMTGRSLPIGSPGAPIPTAFAHFEWPPRRVTRNCPHRFDDATGLAGAAVAWASDSEARSTSPKENKDGFR